MTPMKRVIAFAHYLECADSSMSNAEAAECIRSAMEHIVVQADHAKDAALMRDLQDTRRIALLFGTGLHAYHVYLANR